MAITPETEIQRKQDERILYVKENSVFQPVHHFQFYVDLQTFGYYFRIIR